MDASEIVRCSWAAGAPLLLAYHDSEWGVPTRDERHLFELLCLEGAQAGLSWLTILRKREGYRRAFEHFEPAKVARFTPRTVQRLLGDPGIVRHKQKIESIISNARLVPGIRDELGSFSSYLWRFAGDGPRQNAWKSPSRVPAETAQSLAMSKDLRRRGFRFVGPTICYSFMQAVGMVNDHLVGCFRHREVGSW